MPSDKLRPNFDIEMGKKKEEGGGGRVSAFRFHVSMNISANSSNFNLNRNDIAVISAVVYQSGASGE